MIYLRTYFGLWFSVWKKCQKHDHCFYGTTHCGNFENLLSLFFDKKFRENDVFTK